LETKEAIEWCDTYNIGVEEIDRQHRELFELFGDLMEAKGFYRDEHKVMHTLKKISHYVNKHFFDEEGCMRRHNYPFLEEHISQHKSIVTQIKNAIKNSESSPDLKQNLEELLFAWISKHIIVEDRDFACWAKENNIKF